MMMMMTFSTIQHDCGRSYERVVNYIANSTIKAVRLTDVHTHQVGKLVEFQRKGVIGVTVVL